MKLDLSTWKSSPMSGSIIIEELITTKGIALMNVDETYIETYSMDDQDHKYAMLL